MKEPANLYEAVIALESLKNRKPAEPVKLTKEQQEALLTAIRAAVYEDLKCYKSVNSGRKRCNISSVKCLQKPENCKSSINLSVSDKIYT